MVDLEDVQDGCRNLALSTHLEQVMPHLVHHGVVGNHGVSVGGHGECEGAKMKAWYERFSIFLHQKPKKRSI